MLERDEKKVILIPPTETMEAGNKYMMARRGNRESYRKYMGEHGILYKRKKTWSCGSNIYK